MKSQHFLLRLKISSLSFAFFLFLMCVQNKKNIDTQGHRGCRGLFPENTLPAFEHAIDLGVHTLELDIAITKDNKVVVSHEPFMNALICLKPNGETMTKDEGLEYNLYQMSYDSIKQFDCGTKFHPTYPEQKKLKTFKPLLSEVFDLVKSKKAKVNFNIEIKSKPEYYSIYTPQPEAYVKLVLDEINTSGLAERVNLQSFDLTILEEIKKQSSQMPVALLVEEDESITTKLESLSFKPEIISPYFKLLTEASIKSYQAQGYKIIPWTINEVEHMRQLIDWQVDGIITDYPDRLIGVLNQ